jgi:sugar (pentulose or hexulose) kinase
MTSAQKSSAKTGPITLAIDIGGSGLKASALDASGKMLTDRLRVPTPYPVTGGWSGRCTISSADREVRQIPSASPAWSAMAG